jgi:hypothetical protein
MNVGATRKIRENVENLIFFSAAISQHNAKCSCRTSSWRLWTAWRTTPTTR